jgi:phosphate transport system permease protein
MPAIIASDNIIISDATTRRESIRDVYFGRAMMLAALAVLFTLGTIIVTLAIGAEPIFKQQGLGFFINRDWDPVNALFGALPAIYGTLVTSFIALLLAVPVSFLIAIFLTELCPARLRTIYTGLIELLAGIPSIIYGMWGLFVLAPLLADHVQPVLNHWFAHVPWLNKIFSGPPIGIGLLPAGLILAIMIIPLITSVMRDVFDVVPSTLKEGGYGIGATRWEVIRDIVLPYTRVPIFGGIMLGLGRALGETMAVTFMIGNANVIEPGLFNPGNSIASVIANEFAEAANPMHLSALIALGLILFLIAFVVLIIARVLIKHASRI